MCWMWRWQTSFTLTSHILYLSLWLLSLFTLLSSFYSPFSSFFSRLPTTCFFPHSVSCHCSSAASHSQHSSPSPCLASFFDSGTFLTYISLTGIFLWPPSFSLPPPIIFSVTLLPRSLSFLFLCDIQNPKNSRRDTHTWPSSVSATVTDNLSSAEPTGHSFFVPSSLPFPLALRLFMNPFLCSVWPRQLQGNIWESLNSQCEKCLAKHGQGGKTS